MNKAADKLSVLLLCTAGFAFSDKPVVPVAGLILSVIMTSLVWLNEGTVRAAAVIAVSAVCCVPFPMILCASPLLLFDAMGEKKAVAGGSGAAGAGGHLGAWLSADRDNHGVAGGDGDPPSADKLAGKER